MNQRYASDAIIDDGKPAEIWARDPVVYAQHTSRPGAKLPHAWLVSPEGKKISSLDLVGDGMFTLLTGQTGRIWAEAVSALELPWLRAVVVDDPGARDLYFDWQRSREVAEDGAILVRPDGYVAWRAQNAPGGDLEKQLTDAEEQLSVALSRILGRPVSNLAVSSP